MNSSKTKVGKTDLRRYKYS